MYLDSLPDHATGGATTFPLAEHWSDERIPPLVAGPPSHENAMSKLTAAPAGEDDADQVCQAANELLWNQNRHHTQPTQSQRDARNTTNTGMLLEDAAFKLWRNEEHARMNFGQMNCPSSWRSHRTTAIPRGIRILPHQGHICVFSSQQADGYPNPFSFHAGEALLSRTTHATKDGTAVGGKHVLTFFYEIPMDSFQSREEFGEQVRKRERAFWTFHGWKVGTTTDEQNLS